MGGGDRLLIIAQQTNKDHRHVVTAKVYSDPHHCTTFAERWSLSSSKPKAV
jgi:hypothetical protein